MEPIYDPRYSYTKLFPKHRQTLSLSCHIPSIKVVYAYALENCPNKINVGVRVEFPLNGSTPHYRHSGPSVSACVVSGRVLNKMNDGLIETFSTSESWYEAPDCHHRISDNLSTTERAVSIANMILDQVVYEKDGMAALIQIDEEYQDKTADVA